MPYPHSQKLMFRCLEFVFAIFLFGSVIILSQKFEETYLPVISEFQVLKIEDDVVGNIKISGTMVKNRNCEFKQSTIYIKHTDESTPELISHKFPSNSSSTRATIHQKWGPWTLYLKDFNRGAEIIIYGTHRCHPLYNTTTHLASIRFYEEIIE